MKARLLVILATSALLVGCTSTTYQDTAGNKLSRVSFGTTQNIGKLSVKAGDKELLLEGYSNEQAQVASAVVSAAITAATRK